MNRLLVVIILVLVFVGGCAVGNPFVTNAIEKPVSSFGLVGSFGYYYDEAHDVSIWTWQEVYSGVLVGGISVLPAEQVKNPDAPMKLAK